MRGKRLSMGGAKGGGGGARSPSMFGRNLCRDVESAMKEYNHGDGDQLVGHLRSTYPHYARLKLQPFTEHVRQILHASGEVDAGVSADSDGHEQEEEATPGKRRKEFDESKEKSRLLESSAAFSSSGVGSSEEEVTTSGGDGIDLMKSMMRENYCNKSKKNREVLENGVEKTVNLVHQKDGQDGMEFGEGKGAGNGDENSGPMFEDLGGMSKVIDELIMDALFPLCHPELPRNLGAKPPTGILLHGPPGCGKTMLQ